ncbi:MAG: glyoxalase, partial [Rhodoglobus sp.]|nr:glyoxalase [Rhodoglobus sp.]
MTAISSLTIEAADPVAAETFYADAFGLGARLRVNASDAETFGFRGFTISLVVSQPSTVESLVDSAVA